MKNFKFIHIPKTGGVSICDALGIRVAGHQVNLNNDKNIFTFAFVRNPYDRMVSSFFYLKAGGRNNYDKMDAKKYIGNKSFSEFITNGLEIAIKKQTHFLPQHYYIPNGADFIGKFENIDSDFKKLCKNLNKQDCNLKKLNISKHKNYNEYYDDKLKYIVYCFYRKDFELFDYER